MRGISAFGVLMVLIVLGFAALIGMRVFPSMVEYQAVVRAVQKSKDGSTPAEVRNIFDRAAQVDNVTAIKGQDLDVTKDDNGNVVVRFAYNKELPLGGPVFLLIKYAGQSK